MRPRITSVPTTKLTLKVEICIHSGSRRVHLSSRSPFLSFRMDDNIDAYDYFLEMAMNNGAQCARKTDLNEFGCNIQQGAQPTFVQMLPSPNRQTLKYGTSIILSMNSYNGDDCKYETRYWLNCYRIINLIYYVMNRYIADVTNCILDKYTRGTDFCSSRASTHFGRIFDVMLQGVQCKTGGYSTFNTFDSSNSFNNNPAFNRFPSGSSGSSNNGGVNFPNNNQNNFGSNSGSFPQNFPQGSASNFGGQGTNSFGSNSGSNWPQNQNDFGMNSGNNWPQQNPNSFGVNSGSNWPQQNPSGMGQSSGSFGQSSNNFGQSSGFGSSGTIPPYNRRPYNNSGSALQTTMAMVVTTIFTACLVF